MKKNYVLMALVFFTPVLVLSLHIISNMWISNIQQGVPNTVLFFGNEVTVGTMYDIVLFLIITVSLLIILLMYSSNKTNKKKHK